MKTEASLEPVRCALVNRTQGDLWSDKVDLRFMNDLAISPDPRRNILSSSVRLLAAIGLSVTIEGARDALPIHITRSHRPPSHQVCTAPSHQVRHSFGFRSRVAHLIFWIDVFCALIGHRADGAQRCKPLLLVPNGCCREDYYRRSRVRLIE